MKVFLALIIGIAIGVAALWFLGSDSAQNQVRDAGKELQEATKEGREALEERLRALNIRPEDIQEELNKGGQVVRRKAQQAGDALADATADARITAAIKTKLIADPNLSGLSISVNTTGGVVTLAGPVSSAADVSRAIALAMEVEGVREVISTLQVQKRSPGK
jgi:osmotically-inducible protein OsmY